ncbi:hypothetical protein LUZ60_005348 [Juncus effusus]|nr:hypothetical protein LUZ60_005348 [Juncus effusus]
MLTQTQPCISITSLSKASPSPSIVKFISDHHSLTLLETKCTTMNQLRQLHSHLIRTGLVRDQIAASRLISFCTARTELRYARKILSHHPEPNSFMFNTVIRALSKSSVPQLAVEVFVEMLGSCTEPDRLTFPSVFVGYSRLGLGSCGRALHAMMVKLGLARDVYIRNAMLGMYAACGFLTEASRILEGIKDFDVVLYNSMVFGLAKNGLVDEARKLFDEMPKRTVTTWSSMISGYVRNSRNKEAMELFFEMQNEGVNPNIQILVSLLAACANLGSLDQGIWIHNYLEKNEFEFNPLVVTALIDMYCKCGSIDKALKVFDEMPVKQISYYNSLIMGLGVHGNYEKAIELFSQLENSILKPDNVTFISVLMACSHAGKIQEAKHYFSLMSEKYDIKPEIQHYTCMVDTLGRAGLLNEAEDLITKMPIKPDKVIYACLISHCKVHKNVEMGKRAAKKVVELDPKDRGGYVILANMLGADGKFEESVDLRVKMEEREVREERGGSSIEVGGVVHEFLAHGGF